MNSHAIQKNSSVLIFDAECPLCSGAAHWIEENAEEGAFELLPCQDGERASRFPGIEGTACMNAMHLVRPEGEVLVGDEALPAITIRLKHYWPAAVLFQLPGAAAVARIAYRWFADRRYRIAAFLSHLKNTNK